MNHYPYYKASVVQFNIDRKHKYIYQSIGLYRPTIAHQYVQTSVIIEKICDVRLQAPLKVKKKVSFDDHVVVYEYETVIPCLQEAIANWNESKRIHLQSEYLRKYGTLDGFNYDKECAMSDQIDEIFSQEHCLDDIDEHLSTATV